ncbi:MAG: hypothetical protein LH628_12840 [Microcoleus sp. CAN_BIN18]|nr:hypothetical protein [Microcoleus sp. CAN_BIN18]
MLSQQNKVLGLVPIARSSNRGHGTVRCASLPMNCNPRALPCPDFGNINNSEKNPVYVSECVQD